MRRYAFFGSLLLIVFIARFAAGHGTPIGVGQSAGTLAVSGGLSDAIGFAPQLFFEDDEDGDPLPPATLPNVGSVLIWQIPGYNISGLDNQSSLSIEVLARPVKDSEPPEDRILWYWNPSSTLVEPTTSPLHLLGTGMRYTTLSPSEETAPPPFLMAQTLTGQQNFHNHGLLSYALNNSPAPAAGAYGFFARLVSNQYASSEPFLIVLNRGVGYELMVDAALAINAAAMDDESLPGDFNEDGNVNAADYVVWRKNPGGVYTQDDFLIWRGNFGATSSGSGASGATGIPEPAGPMLAALAIAILFACRRAAKFN
jgi:hypothetical protein